MAEYLPSPTGGMNPWGAIVQPTPTPQGVHPILQTLMEERQNRLQNEADTRKAAINQLGAGSGVLGGAGFASSLEQLMKASGAVGDDFRVDPSYYRLADPARVHAANAESTAAIMQGLAQMGGVGIGADVNEDYTAQNYGPLDPRIVQYQALMGSAKAPRNYFDTTSSQGTTDTTTEEGLQFDPVTGFATQRTREIKNEQTQKQEYQQPTTTGSAGSGLSSTGRLRSRARQRQRQSVVPENGDAIDYTPEQLNVFRQLLAVVKGDPRFGPSAGVIQDTTDGKWYIYLPNAPRVELTPELIDELDQAHQQRMQGQQQQ